MSVKLIQISDTHIQPDPADRFDGVDTAATLASVMNHIRTHEQPDLMLLTGDLVHEPNRASYSRLQQLLTPAPANIYAIPGNHDDPDLMQSVLTGPVYHDRDIVCGNWRILMLNSWLEGEHAGYLSQEELSWLEKSLAQQTGKPTLIALHHPPVSIGSRWMDAMGLHNAADLRHIMRRHSQIRAVIWGHIHQVFESETDGITLLSCPSTCIQFRPGSETYASDHKPPGYRRLLLLDNGSIEGVVIRV